MSDSFETKMQQSLMDITGGRNVRYFPSVRRLSIDDVNP